VVSDDLTELREGSAPTLVVLGRPDRYLGPEPAEPDDDDAPGLDRVERLPNASHWVHHDVHQRVTQLLSDLVAPAGPTRSPAPATIRKASSDGEL
jgi:epoxide hydrolase 4